MTDVCGAATVVCVIALSAQAGVRAKWFIIHRVESEMDQNSGRRERNVGKFGQKNLGDLPLNGRYSYHSQAIKLMRECSCIQK